MSTTRTRTDSVPKSNPTEKRCDMPRQYTGTVCAYGVARLLPVSCICFGIDGWHGGTTSTPITAHDDEGRGSDAPPGALLAGVAVASFATNAATSFAIAFTLPAGSRKKCGVHTRRSCQPWSARTPVRKT